MIAKFVQWLFPKLRSLHFKKFNPAYKQLVEKYPTIYANREKFPFFFDFVNNSLVKLSILVGVSFAMENEMLVANIPTCGTNVKINLDRRTALVFMCDQFVRKSTYNFILDKSTIVMDVGMNIADSSLAFAANSYVTRVFAYELIPQIVERAMVNIGLNPEIAPKIVVNNYGLGVKNSELEVPYYDSFDAGSGLYNDSRQKMFRGKAQNTKCVIKDICEEVKLIVETYPDEQIFLKIDAEGAEYEMIDALFSSVLGRHIKYVALEYHFGVKNIVDILMNQNFEVIQRLLTFDMDSSEHEVGCIQAVRLADRF